MDKEQYSAINGLRTLATIGIVMMHMATNNNYHIDGYFYNVIIPSFADFVFLFMMISAFGMCCGYYEKLLYNKITLGKFYGNRFRKIFPFFAMLVLLDLMVSPSIDAFYEAFADLTLMFGFLPDAGSISVIGVGWFLGLIFVFYLCFPFFCWLLESKKRALVSFVLSLMWNLACIKYFHIERTNILYCACFFLMGGLIYLYRRSFSKMNKWFILGIAIVATITYYIVGSNTGTRLLMFAMFLIYGTTSSRLLTNRAVQFLSDICMEIYLSHMLVFRIMEKLRLNTMIGTGWVQYLSTVVMVVIGASVLALTLKKIMLRGTWNLSMQKITPD